MPSEMPAFHRQVLRMIERRDASNPISYQDIAAALSESPREVRKTVEDLVMVYHHPICSSYNAKRPGYFMPRTAEEVSATCRTMIRHGAAIIRRAKVIGRYSDERVLGQLRLELARPGEAHKEGVDQ